MFERKRKGILSKPKVLATATLKISLKQVPIKNIHHGTLFLNDYAKLQEFFGIVIPVQYSLPNLGVPTNKSKTKKINQYQINRIRIMLF